MTASFLAARMLVDLYQQRDKGRKARQIGNLFAFDRGAKVIYVHISNRTRSRPSTRSGQGGFMKRTRNFYVGVTIAAVIAVLAIAQFTLQTVARAQENGSANRAGIYEVDRMWPKPLPNNWVLGSTVGLAIDARDHVFIVHRGQSSLDQKFASQMAFAPAAPRGGGGRAGARACRWRLRGAERRQHRGRLRA